MPLRFPVYLSPRTMSGLTAQRTEVHKKTASSFHERASLSHVNGREVCPQTSANCCYLPLMRHFRLFRDTFNS